MTEYFNRQPASDDSQPHPRCLCEEILGRSISGVMCLLDYSRDHTMERGEEAAERVADWEQSLSERWQSGSPGHRSGPGSNTSREPRYVRTIKTNQAPSATPSSQAPTVGCRPPPPPPLRDTNNYWCPGDVRETGSEKKKE
ncbi:unnamed protein product [Pleuronectes platessa]|uniref:Uncharacterized protein n=1 Tax=Pleuronectes platessa TaxID=8262 RepID=A0A9N7VBY7_PLEPL|nr:unnamed protein product [Pleuronectes platessa]